MTSQGQLGGWSQPIREAAEAAAARRARVLAHPDIARRLTDPPLCYRNPEAWNGHVPPATIEGPAGPVRNTSRMRLALISILTATQERERELAEEAASGTE